MTKELLILFINESNHVASIPLKTIEEQWKDKKLVNLGSKKNFQIFITHKNSQLFFFTNLGKVYGVNSEELIGTPLNIFVKDDHCFIDFLSFKEIIKKNEKKPEGEAEEINEIQIVTVISEYDLNLSKKSSLFLVTKNGIGKKLEIDHVKGANDFGRKIITLQKGDQLKEVKRVNENTELVLISTGGRAVKFNSSSLRELGRAAVGVKTINLKTPYLGGKNHEVAFATNSLEGDHLLIIGDKGFGKRIKLNQFPLVRRGGKGVICHNFNSAGWIIYASCVNQYDYLIGYTRRNYLHKIDIKDIFLTDKRYARGELVLKEKSKVYDSLVGVIKYIDY